MRGFNNYSLDAFTRDIKDIVQSELSYQFLGSSQGLVDPEQLLQMPNVKEIRFILKTFGRKDLQLLALMHHFFKPEFKAIMRLDIEQNWRSVEIL